MMAEEKKPSPVYCSWTTVQNALDQLAKATPSCLDRTVFPGIAWSVQSQLLTGFRFLGLIDEEGKTSSELVQLAEDTENRKQNWEKLLRNRYRFIVDHVDLSTATPKQVEDAMNSYGVGKGDTLDKAVRFFLSAASFAGFKLSPYLSKARKGSVPRKKRASSRRTPGAGSAPSTLEAEKGSDPQIPGLTIELKSGGKLSLSANVDLFSMSTGDRSFVFKLIDDLKNYEADSNHD